MENTEKVEIGYTLPKERWQEAAKNLEDLGNALAMRNARDLPKDAAIVVCLSGRGDKDMDSVMNFLKLK